MISKDLEHSIYLTQDQLKQVKKAFEIFDRDGSGTITTNELDHILKSLGQYLEKEQLDQLVERIDLDKNGLIEFNEFLAIVTEKILLNRSEAIFIETFKILDFDGDGLIRQEQLEKALKYLNNTKLTNQDIREMMEYLLPDEEGINMDRFLQLMLRRF